MLFLAVGPGDDQPPQRGARSPAKDAPVPAWPGCPLAVAGAIAPALAARRRALDRSASIAATHRDYQPGAVQCPSGGTGRPHRNSPLLQPPICAPDVPVPELDG